jgi:hypothetical protein
VKRVLNSGSIKLPYIIGSESVILTNASAACGTNDLDVLISYLFQIDALKHFKFTFEIKAPQLIFQSFQNAHLGAFKLQRGQDHQTAYVPAQFYRLGPSEFIPMDPKSCNELNTKLNNFFNWSFNFYNKLIEGGLCPEQAELVLPQGVFKTFLWEINAGDLILFVKQNINKSPEMNGYCSTLVLYMEDHLPQITRWLKANKWKDLV